jgi:hypothetical protein
MIIDEISMVSLQTLKHIHCRLGEIRGTPDNVPFGGINLITIGDSTRFLLSRPISYLLSSRVSTGRAGTLDKMVNHGVSEEGTDQIKVSCK